jgi:hypothetical protein
MTSREACPIAFIALACLSAYPAYAQSSWTISPGAQTPKGETLTVRGYYLSSSIVRPSLTLQCRDGKLLSSWFNTYIAPGKASERGFLHKSEKAPVLFRVGEKKEQFKRWQVADGSLALRPDTKFVRNFISSDHTVIEFLATPSGEMRAKFDPSPADLPRIKQACGLK